MDAGVCHRKYLGWGDTADVQEHILLQNTAVVSHHNPEHQLYTNSPGVIRVPDVHHHYYHHHHRTTTTTTIPKATTNSTQQQKTHASNDELTASSQQQNDIKDTIDHGHLLRQNGKKKNANGHQQVTKLTTPAPYIVPQSTPLLLSLVPPPTPTPAPAYPSYWRPFCCPRAS